MNCSGPVPTAKHHPEPCTILRTITKHRLQEYINRVNRDLEQMAETARSMGKWGDAWFQEQMVKMGPTVDLNAQIILFGETGCLEFPSKQSRGAVSVLASP